MSRFLPLRKELGILATTLGVTSIAEDRMMNYRAFMESLTSTSEKIWPAKLVDSREEMLEYGLR